MRIAYVLTRADAVGGASIHVRDLARAMIARGHEAAVFIGGEGPVTEQLRDAGVPFHPLRFLCRPISPLGDALAFFELKRALARFQPDLVSTHTAKAGWIGRAACSRLGIPALYTPHGWTISDRLGVARGRIFHRAEQVAARWSAGIVCVCEYERRLALDARIAPAEKLHVIHNGVHDVPLRAEPGREPVRIVSIARAEPPKDYDTLFAALASLTDLDWDLELIGDGTATLNAPGIAERVRSAGYQPDPAVTLARAQVFVLSSRSEGFPRSILEAMRAALPVVASDVGGVSEAVAHNRTGLLVRRGDAQELAAALRTLLVSPGQRVAFGNEARRIYEQRFTFERMLESTAALYDTLVGNAVGMRDIEPS